MWLVAVLVSAFVRILGGGRGSHVGKSSAVVLFFGFGMDSCQTFVILNHCTKCGFFRFSELQIFVWVVQRFSYRFRW